MPSKHFAKRSLGQNFLTDENVVDKIIRSVRPQADETFLEIGPGRGAITRRLLASAEKVIAIELDRELVPRLRVEFSGTGNFEIIEGDALAVDLSTLNSGSPMRVVANLPYYISTPILQRLIEYRENFVDMTLMFQREVVDRITAKPGNSERGFLTVLVEAYLSSEKLFDVPPTAFSPRPKVWSSIVRLSPKTGPLPPPSGFRQLVSAAFAQKRKTILNNLRSFLKDAETTLADSGIEPSRRSETLAGEEWLRLFEHASASIRSE